LTYSAPLYVDVKKTALTAQGVEDPAEADWQPILDENGREADKEEQKVWIGKVSYSQEVPGYTLFF
jgi:DNA-directed RNA polymerase II subunit RPB2